MREFCENKLQVRCPKGDFWQYVGSPVNAKARVLEFFGMVRTAMIVALLALCTTPLSFGQAASVSDSVKLDALRQRAEQGDAKAQVELGFTYENGLWGVSKNYGEALRWYRKAAEQGDPGARLELGRMYLDGEGVNRDYVEAARWYGCPKLAEGILLSCTETSYGDLPKEAFDLLTKMKCDVIGSNYDYGSAVNLNGDGIPTYQICCHDAPHGPCDSVLIGRIGNEWKNLTAKEGLLGYLRACGDFFPLESQHDGFHDVCLPNQCSSGTGVKGKACAPTIWQFSNGRYRSVAFTVAKPPQ